MKIFVKAILFLLGVAIIGAVIWLGFLTANNQSPKLVAIFGIASAVIAPIGLTLIGYIFTANDQDVINRLAKVPEIEKLITEASSQEEKIRLLEKQKQQLAEIIQFEARRQSLVNRKETNEREAVRLLDELMAIDTELSNLEINVSENKEIAEALDTLRKRIAARQRGDIIVTLGKRSFIFDSGSLRETPSGLIIYNILRLISKILTRLTDKGSSEKKIKIQ